MEPDVSVKQFVSRGAFAFLSIPWPTGFIIYIVGVLMAASTGNAVSFLRDYPWACFALVNSVGAWATHNLTDRHLRCTVSIRKIFSASDEAFETVLGDNMRRLTHPRNLIFGLVFLPALIWAWTQRLWWQGYNAPFLFDLFYLLNLALMFPLYAGLMFGAAVACNQNVYKLCEKTPIDCAYTMNEGQTILRSMWGGQLARVTAVALIMSALTNVPILLYSGGLSLFLNLAIALSLAVLIFLTPHYMFHRLLERAKEEMLSKVLNLRSKIDISRLEDLGRNMDKEGKIDNMFQLIYLSQYEADLRNRSTWIVNLEVIMELLVVGSLHVMFMEILTTLTGI